MSQSFNPFLANLVITGFRRISCQFEALNLSTGSQYLIPLFTENINRNQPIINGASELATEAPNLAITSYFPISRQYEALDLSTGDQYLIPLCTENDDQPIINRASESAIEALPIVEIKEKDLECAICLDMFEIGGETKEMTCKHKFHSGCIEKWLRVNGSCPVCRYKMPEEEEAEEEIESDSETAQGDGEERSVEDQRELRIRFVNGGMTIDWVTISFH